MLDITVEKKVPKTGANLAYFASKPLRPSENINITNIGVSNNDLPSISVSKVFSVDVDASGYLPAMAFSDFVMSDELDANSNPLFYSYATRYTCYDSSSAPEDNLLLIDKDGVIIDDIYYKFEASATSEDYVYDVNVYTNQNNEDGITRKIRYNKVDGDSVVRSATEVMNSTTIYSDGTVASTTEYEISVQDDGLIKVKPPTTGSTRWYIKILNSSSIYLKSPLNVGEDEDWYCRVKHSKAYKKVGSVLLEYSVPDYDSQSFDAIIGSPVAKAISEVSEYVDSHTVKVVQTPMYAELNSVKRPIGMSIFINNRKLNYGDVLDWDTENGLILLKPIIKSTDVIKVSYRYTRNYLEYSGYELGGSINDLNLNPTKFHTPDITESTIYIYHEPSRNLTTGTILATDNAVRYTTDSSILTSGSTRLLIGKIEVTPNSSISDVQVVDTRSKGGGIDSNITDIEARNVNAESSFFSNIGTIDGKAYQPNGVLMIEVPSSILGTFTEEQIKSKVNKYLPAGYYAFIKYVD